jgi:RNA polymerase sigma-70 factor, ECF subfamily
VVAVSRRITAPVDAIFRVLADPRRHADLDGSGMVRGTTTTAPLTAVGDVFTMAMHFPAIGDYEMDNHVVAFEQDRRLAWEPAPGRGHPEAVDGSPDRRWGHRWAYELQPDGPDATIVTEVYDCSRAPEAARTTHGGRTWTDAMTRTLERLERRCVSGFDPANDGR